KSSKKKESSSGTPSPSSTSVPNSSNQGQSPANSNHGTPTSSTTTVNDTKGKPLIPPDNPSGGLSVGGIHHHTQGMSSASPGGQHFIPHPPNLGGLGPQMSSNGPGAMARQPPSLAPSVVISPSVPVC